MKIHELRGTKVILDRDLAELYGVTTGNLYKAAKFQNGISRWGGSRTLPYSPTAIQVSITEQGTELRGRLFDQEIPILQEMADFCRIGHKNTPKSAIYHTVRTMNACFLSKRYLIMSHSRYCRLWR